MAALTTMVKRLAGCVGTHDLSDWEDDFVRSILEQSRDGDDTTRLSEPQITIIERIFRRHFAA